MKIIENTLNRVNCEHCGSTLEIETGDLHWTHTEEDYYYAICPICGLKFWIKKTKYWDHIWEKQQHYDSKTI